MTDPRELFEAENPGKSWFTNPVCHGELAFVSWDYQLWLESRDKAHQEKIAELEAKIPHDKLLRKAFLEDPFVTHETFEEWIVIIATQWLTQEEVDNG